jgi:hypothetical protein
MTPRSHSATGRKLCIEQLEPRTVLNGTVTVSLSGSGLAINGDASANSIIVHQVGKNADGGAIIQVQGAGTKIENQLTGKSGTSFNFGGTTGITDISIFLAGGNDVLNFFNTSVTGDINVDMGDGNDVVSMTHVHTSSIDSNGDNGVTDALEVELGSGRNTAVLTHVSVNGDIEFGGGLPSGQTTAVFNGVSAGTYIDVNFGSSRSNSATIINCSAQGLDTFDDGPDGVLTGVGNNFGAQIVTTFRFRSGDLVNNVV